MVMFRYRHLESISEYFFKYFLYNYDILSFHLHMYVCMYVHYRDVS